MPVPLLPLELIRLIAEYVVDDLDEHAGRAECFRLARVCKAWGALVQPLAWRTLTVDPGIDVRPLDYILEHPEVLRHVDDFNAYCPRPSAGDSFSFGEISESQAAKLVAALRSCTNLRELELAPCAAPFRLLAAASMLPLASSLNFLALVFIADTLKADFIVSCLTRFAGLRLLDLLIACNNMPESLVTTKTTMPLLPIRKLTVSLRGSADFERFLFGLTSRIDSVTMTHCTLDDFCGSLVLFDWLVKCENLTALAIYAPNMVLLDILLDDVCMLLPKLVSLDDIDLFPVGMTAHHPSSSLLASCELSQLLDGLAAVKVPVICKLGGLFFKASGADYPVYPRLGGDDPYLREQDGALFAFAQSDDENDDWYVDLEEYWAGLPIQLVHIPDKGGSGRKRWYRVPWLADDAANN